MLSDYLPPALIWCRYDASTALQNDRFRPPNALELREGGSIVVEIDDTNTNVKLSSSSDPPGGFNFDRAFGIQSTQEEIFEYGVRGIVEDVVAGYNGTVFAYGQTGSGKSFTMMVRRPAAGLSGRATCTDNHCFIDTGRFSRDWYRYLREQALMIQSCEVSFRVSQNRSLRLSWQAPPIWSTSSKCRIWKSTW